MLKPMISDRVRIVQSGQGEYTAIAADSILAGTVIEICPVMPMQCRLAMTIGKTIPLFDQQIIVDVDMIDRELDYLEIVMPFCFSLFLFELN